MKTLALLVAVPLVAQVSWDRVRNSSKEPGSWLTYSGNLQGHRYSTLTAINRSNAANLKPAWIYQIDRSNKFETVPLVADGVMYISEPPSNVTALDPRTGRALWSYRRPIAEGLPICCGYVNRGVALLDDLVFVGTLDAHLVALDSRTGNVVWDTEVASVKAGHSITVAPLAVRDKIVIGMAGGELGVRGFLDAYDAKTGKRAWRFYTIPAPGEPGNDTWAGDSWKNGSATTWTTGSYDPDSNTVFWGTGNPGPDWHGSHRKGDNLYSDSLVALDANTGRLRWHFQFTPHDEHDWDSTQVPVLVNRPWHGSERRLVLFGNRNAFFYVLDRDNGRFLLGKPFARQTWATGLENNGRPIRVPDMWPTKEGTLVYPSVPGATNYFSPAYSPQTGLFYVAARDEGALYFTDDKPWEEGKWFLGGRWIFKPAEERSGAVRAIDPETGDRKWEFPLFSPPWAGLLATAGGLVFGGSDEGWFFAVDAATGELLWRFQTGGRVLSSPVTYTIDGKQYVAIAAGHDIFTFGL